MRSSQLLSGRSSPLPSRFTDASVLTATTREAPSARACARYVTWPRCRISKTPLVSTTGLGSCEMQAARAAREQIFFLKLDMANKKSRKKILAAPAYTSRATNTDTLRQLRGLRRSHPRNDFLAIPVQFLHCSKRALEQQRHVVQNALDDFLFPLAVELDLVIEPCLEPLRIRQAA